MSGRKELINNSGWIEGLKLDIESIGEDLILFDKIKQMPYFDHPIKQDKTVITILQEGKVEAGLNLKKHFLEAPCIIFSPRGHIAQYFSATGDAKASIIGITGGFAENLQVNSNQLLPLFFFFWENPIVPLKSDELSLLMGYYSLIREIVNQKNEMFHKEAAISLIRSFIFSISNIAQPFILNETVKKSRQETIFRDFMWLIPQHYKEERNLEFYAGKLSLTPKHLSEVIKKVSKKPANRWIDDFVCLEAKAMLKSSSMTIQEISQELNFTSQSFFGKYFKRIIGMSPKEYRNC